MKLFFAGSENHQHRKMMIDLGVKNMLFSYKWIRERGGVGWEKIFRELKESGRELFLDSGAFYWREMARLHKKITGAEEYINDYILFLEKVGGYLDWYCELDIDTVIGWDRVKEYRERMWKKGLKPVLVYQATIPNIVQEWVKWRDYPGEMLAIGSMMKKRVSEKYNDQMAERVEGKKVHLFGITSGVIANLKRIYSVDSTNWVVGARYGAGFVFKNGKLIGVSFDRNSKEVGRYRDYIESKGLNFEKLKNRDTAEITALGIIAHLDFQEYLDNRDAHKERISRIGEEGEAKKMEKLEGNSNALKTAKNSNLRGLVCDNCFVKDKCPSFIEGSICAVEKDFEKILETVGTRNVEVIVDWLKNIFEENLKRMYTNLLFEKLEGGVIDKQVSALIRDIFDQAERIKRLSAEGVVSDDPLDELRRLLLSLEEKKRKMVIEGTVNDNGRKNTGTTQKTESETT